MAKIAKKIPVEGTKSLEMAMRDVLDSLTDSVSYLAYQPGIETFKILSIEAPKQVNFDSPPAEVICVTSHKQRSRDVVDYLIRRETQLERIAN